MFGVCVFVFVCVLRHAEKNVEKTVCGFKNTSVCTFKTYTQGRFEWTHGRQGGVIASSALPEFAHVWLPRGLRGPPKKPMDPTHFQFENRSESNTLPIPPIIRCA